jgi:hypothetical protein
MLSMSQVSGEWLVYGVCLTTPAAYVWTAAMPCSRTTRFSLASHATPKLMLAVRLSTERHLAHVAGPVTGRRGRTTVARQPHGTTWEGRAPGAWDHPSASDGTTPPPVMGPPGIHHRRPL